MNYRTSNCQELQSRNDKNAEDVHQRSEKRPAYSSIPVLGQARAGSVVHSDPVSTIPQKLHHSHFFVQLTEEHHASLALAFFEVCDEPNRVSHEGQASRQGVQKKWIVSQESRETTLRVS